MTRRLLSLGCRFQKNSAGVVAVEFALVVPILVFLFIGGTEVANLALTHMRVSQVASLTANNVARVRDRIDETDVNELLVGSVLSGSQVDLTSSGRIIIYTIEDNAATAGNTVDQKVTWQRCKGIKNVTPSFGVDGQILAGPIGTGGVTIAATAGAPVVAVEVFYDYQPVFGSFLFGNRTIHYTSAYSVRDRTDQSIQNSQSLTGAQRATCNFFTA